MIPRISLNPRPGASLVVTLCVLVLIECVVIGTLHLALQERRLATAAVDLLRLRLAADAVLVRALAAEWPGASSDVTVWHGEPVAGIEGRASAHPAGHNLLLVRAVAAERPPGHGVASAAAVVLPPVLPAFNAARHLQPPGDGRLDAVSDSVLKRVLTAPGIAELAGVREFAGTVDHDVAGVIISRGDLRIAERVRVRGLVVVAGVLSVEAHASVTGAVVAPFFHADGSQFTPDAELVMTSVRAAGLLRPRPVPGRSRVPGF